jgi:lantibiotic modifying enzyme
VRIEGHLAAIGQFAGWLVAAHGEDEAGPFWPARVAFEALGSKPAAPEATRTAWCYGSPGIARALFLAGRALGDEPLCELALRAARALVPAGGAGPGLESPTVCHGQAGLLQFLLRMAWDTGDGRLARGAANLSAQLAAGFDESAPFGYRDVERDGERAIALDKAGVLTGAAGVGLALASAGGGRAPVWDHALLFA